MKISGIDIVELPEVDELALSIAQCVATISYDVLGVETITATKKLILDALAVTIGGIPEPGAQELSRIMSRQGGRAEAMIIGSGERLPANLAATVNSTMCRALDFDDVSEVALMHTTASVVPAALAAAQSASQPIDGKEFITAIALGIDLANRISLAGLVARSGTSGPRLIAPTFLVGVFTAAAVSSRIWKLDVRQTVHALGLAHSQASGNQQATFDGALAVRVQQGLATGNGMFSARMAAEGITGPSHPFEGIAGHFAVHWQGKYDRSSILAGLGTEFSVDQVSIKPYPCCKFAHNAIFACLAIRDEHPGLIAQDIDHIDVHIPSREYFDVVCVPVELKQEPKTQVDAQFSIPFTVAVALLRGVPQPEDFYGESLWDPRLRELSKKVRSILQEPLTNDLPAPATVVVHMNDGSQKIATSRFAPGHPRRPMTWEELATKLGVLSARPARKLSPDRQLKLLASCRSIEDCADIDKWAEEHLRW